MLKFVKLHDIGPVQDLSAEFGERLNVLTGDNGLGKSFLLDVCFWCLTGGWPGGRAALPEPSGEKMKPAISYAFAEKDAGTSRRRTNYGGRGNFDHQFQGWSKADTHQTKSNLVVYASADGGFAVWDSARAPRQQTMIGLVVMSAGRLPVYQFNPDQLANGLRDGDRVLCNGLIADWTQWFYERSSKSGDNPFAYLESVINLLSHPLERIECEEPRKVYVNDSRKFPTLRMPYGLVPYPQWSAGVRRIIHFAYSIVWAWIEHKQAAILRNEKPTNQLTLIVDEIEAHLHPKWQRTILPAILKVAETLQPDLAVQILVSTHSPLVLASLEPHFDKTRDQLFSFDLDLTTGQVVFENPPWVMEGDVVAWLTSDIFDLEQARSVEAETAIEAANAYMRGERKALPAGLRTKDQIHKELMRVLPGLDPFWPRWIVTAKPKGVPS